MNKASLYFILLFAGWLLCSVAVAQSVPDAEKCAKASGDDETIAAHTRMITSGQLSSSNLAMVFYGRGTAWSHKGDYDCAIADYSQAIRLNPQYAWAYENRGVAWWNKGDYDRAIADFDAAIRLNPQRAVAYNSRGMTWGNKGDYDRAIADYDEAIRLNPQYADAYDNRGVAWGNKGDYDRAIVDFDAAIRLNPQLAQAYYSRGYARSSKGDYDHAIADFDAAIRLDSKNAVAYRDRGITRFAQGQFEFAQADFSAALRLNSRNAYSVIWRYFAQCRSDHRAAAASELAYNAAKVDRVKWPAPIIDLLAGTTDVDGLLKVAASGDQKTQREQMCEAAFYVGEWHLLRGGRPEARASLEQAERDCPKDFLEHFSASAELKRLSQ